LSQLTAYIDLGDIQLAEGTKLTWVHALPAGKKKHPVHGTLDFSQSRLQHFANGINNKVRKIDPVVDYEHATDPARGKIAAGWIKQAEVRANGLWLGVQFTDGGKKDVKAGNYRYISAELWKEWEDEDGKKYKDIVVAATLTNRPYMKSLEEFKIAASDDFIATLQEPEDQSEPLGTSDLAEQIRQIFAEGDPNYFDVSFVQDMVRNHVDAILSAVSELRSGNADDVKKIARDVIREERGTLDTVLNWIVAWDGTKQSSPIY